MAGTGAVTKEAKALNPERGYFEDRMAQLTARERRRSLILLLAPGEALDQQMVDLAASGAQSWAPYTVLRQLLAEAGARSIGAGLIVSAARLEQLETQLRAGITASSSREERAAIDAGRGAGAR